MRRTVNRIEPEIKFAIKEYADLATELKVQVKNIEPILQKTDILMDSLNTLQLNATVTKLNETLDGINDIMTSLQDNDGTIGKLMSNDSIYNNLNKLLLTLMNLPFILTITQKISKTAWQEKQETKRDYTGRQ